MPEASIQKSDYVVQQTKKKGCLPNKLYHKLIFTASLFFILWGVVTVIVRPSLLFFVFTVLFIACMINRGFKYAGFPQVPHLLEVQFALANGPVFMGCFIYRNSFAFHNLDKMTTCLIHILPPLISYCIRWFPEQSSIWWWAPFENTSASPRVEDWYHVNNWIYLYAIPNAAFIVHCIIYHVVVHVIFKPSEKYNDSYRYLCTKTSVVQKPKKMLPKKLHLVVWMLFNCVSNAIFMLLACFAWCSFFVHTAMLFVIFFNMTWNGACYFVDYLPTVALRKAIADGTIPAPQAQTGGAATGRKSGGKDETDDELDGDEIEVGDEASVEYEMGESEDEDY